MAWKRFAATRNAVKNARATMENKWRKLDGIRRRVGNDPKCAFMLRHLIGAFAMMPLARKPSLRTTAAGIALSLVLFSFLLFAVPDARAQEGAISPPPPLQWPVLAGPNAKGDFSITILRQLIELGGNEELCKILMKEANQPIPANFEWSLCPPEFQAKVIGRQGKVSWASGAKPTECGTNCLGRPFMNQSRSLDRPNVIFAMLYGHLDFAIDVPGPFNRNVRFGYEAQFYCLTQHGAREGDFNIRMVFGTPVVSEPGILESITDFIILPANISRAIERGIRRSLSTPGSQSQSLGRCSSIGANKDVQPAFDSIRFDLPQPGMRRPPVRIIADTALGGKSATVRFVRITRKPVFGYTPAAAPGQFNVFLNGIPAYFPDTPALNLPPAGGSAAINFCKTIDTDGSDRLQIIFVNSHGGAVWSQFAPNTNFGAGPARTMVTGRTVVVAGQPGPPNPVTGKPGSVKPQPVVLREFELLYTIEHRAPANQSVAMSPVNIGGTKPTRPGAIFDSRAGKQATIDPGGGQLTQPCRPI